MKIQQRVAYTKLFLGVGEEKKVEGEGGKGQLDVVRGTKPMTSKFYPHTPIVHSHYTQFWPSHGKQV